MPGKISFASMIDSFGVPFKVEMETAEGEYAPNGDWIAAGTQPQDALGVFLPLGDKLSLGDELKYSSSGTHSEKDRKLLTLFSLSIGQIVEYKGDRYTVQEFKDLTDYTDVNIYVARWSG